MSRPQKTKETKETKVDASPPPQIFTTPALEAHEWEDENILKLVQTARDWNQGNEVSAANVVDFIYHLVFYAYNFLKDREGRDRRRIVLAIVLHCLETKPDWPSDAHRDEVVNIVHKVGVAIVNSNSINLKQMAQDVLEEIKECSPCCFPKK